MSDKQERPESVATVTGIASGIEEVATKSFWIELADLPVLRDIVSDIHEDGAVTLGDGCVAHHYKNPGKKFSENIAAAIYKMFVPVTSFAFGADMTGYWQNRQRGGYLQKSRELVLVTDPENRVIGWSAYAVIDDPACTIIYNDSSGVIPPWQGKGIMSMVFALRVTACRKEFLWKKAPLYFSTRTESPVIYKMRQRLMTRMYPNPDCPTPGRVVEHAKILAAWLGQAEKFESQNLIIRNAYDMVDDLYGEPPTNGDVTLDRWIYSQLTPVDAFLLMGEVDA